MSTCSRWEDRCIVGFFDDTGHLDNFHAAAYDFHLDFGETQSENRHGEVQDATTGIIMFRNFAEPAHFQGNVNSLEEIKQFIATNMVPKVVDYAKKDQMERVFEGPIAANVFSFRQQNYFRKRTSWRRSLQKRRTNCTGGYISFPPASTSRLCIRFLPSEREIRRR